MPESMGFSFSLSNGTAYVIPEDQPHAGEIQPGYRIAGFREYMKRIRGVFASHGRPYAWLEMHATHGPVAPCCSFLEMRTEGEHYRMPSGHNFMHAWSADHLRAIDVPPMFGIVTRWLTGYPWDGKVEGADPQRCKIGALIVHDVWGGWGDFNQRGTVYKKQAPTTRKPPFGFQHPLVTRKMIAHGMNRDEVVYYPYWDNRGVLSVDWRMHPMLGGVKASLWHIPSQNKAIVAVTNFNEVPKGGIYVRPQLEKLGLAPKNKAEKLVVVDFETGEPLPDVPVLDLKPLDFRLLMFARAAVAPDAPAAKLTVKGAEKYDASKGAFTTAAIQADLKAHGFHGANVKHYGPQQAHDVLELAWGPGAVEAQVFHVPDQGKALVALTYNGETDVTSGAALDLDKLKMAPKAPGEALIILDLGTGRVLQETCYNARGEVRIVSGRSRTLGEAHVRIPKGATALILFAKQ